MTAEICLIYSLFPEADSARDVAKTLIEQRLAACCNVIPAIESYFRWEGKIQSAQEVILLCKTKQTLAPQVMQFIQKAHPYDIPAVLQLPVSDALPPFLAWVLKETTGPDL